MRRKSLSMPEIGIIAGTRAALGAGVALLIADRLSEEKRKTIGWTLVAVGVLSTIPIMVELMGNGSCCGEKKEADRSVNDS